MENERSARKPTTRIANIQRRLQCAGALTCIVYLVVAVRLGYLQLGKHTDPALLHARPVVIKNLPAERGTIFDRNGEPLALNVTVGDVGVDPRLVHNSSEVVDLLNSYIGDLDADALTAKIDSLKAPSNLPNKRYVLIERSVPYDVVKQIEDRMKADRRDHMLHPSVDDPLDCVDIDTHSIRAYPNNGLAIQVLGRVTETGTDHFAGTSGVELYFDRQLAGQDGKVTAMVDARNRIIPGTVKRVEAIDGKSITLTIDSRIQKVAEDELQKTVTTHNGTSGDVVVLDAHDGDILALANFPTYNPNVRNSTTNAAAWDDRAVHDVYEPGSTLKTLTLSAVLAVQGLQMADRHVYCSGEFQVGDHIIHCAKDPPLYGVHGDETMRDVLKNSCNIGAAKFALGLGAPSLFAYEKAFGLLDKPNCGLPFAGYCRLPDPAVTPWRAIRLANVAFGQGIAITALQLSSVYATIANRGQRVYPRICSDIAPQSPPTQVIPGPVADAMLSMLQTVVQQGTGQAAQIGGYSIGGKTGSAQVFDPKLHHYGDNYVGSFCGIVPLSDPKLVILTVVNDPKPVHWGAVVAAPVVHDVAKRALWFMGIKPDSPGTKDYNTKLTPVPR